jgi:TPP-dependent 2-oxoacid decarboxylase
MDRVLVWLLQICLTKAITNHAYKRSNELNAAYAADGYSRIKEHSIGAVVTT